MTRTCVVAGAAGDLGSAVSRRLAALGDQLILVDLNVAALDATLQSLSGEGHSAAAIDVSDETEVAELADDVRARHQRINAVLSNAGVNGGSFAIATLPYDDFRRTFEVNVFGVFLRMKHFVPLAAASEDAWFLNTSSEAELKAKERRGAHAAFKYGRQGVRTNVICPRPIEGALMRLARSLRRWLKPQPGRL